MTTPPCPPCQTGHLLPFSSIHAAYNFWACSAPACAYVVSASGSAVRFYKGSALPQEKEKGEKRWTEFEF